MADPIFTGVDIDAVHLAANNRGGNWRGNFVPGSLQNRIRQFFLANPDEELTYVDMCIKFECTADQARGAVRELMRREGERCAVESIHIVRGKKAAAA